MDVYTPGTDNFYEDRSVATTTVVNKRRNYENLQRSIQAHKHRLAMARLKKGKNLPTDDVNEDSSGRFRHSTSDITEEYDRQRFRRHTQSSMNKMSKPVKYNTFNAGNSFDRRYDNEQLYIKRYDDFRAKVEDSLAKYEPGVDAKLDANANSLDRNHHPNRSLVESDELEKKIVEVLGKLLLKDKTKSEALSQYPQAWAGKPSQDGDYDKVADLLVKCISTTLTTAANDSDNLRTSRTNKSVNVEINLNIPKTTEEPPVTVTVAKEPEEVGDLFVENVFAKDTKVVEDGAFARLFNRFSCFSASEKKRPSKTQPPDSGRKNAVKSPRDANVAALQNPVAEKQGDLKEPVGPTELGRNNTIGRQASFFRPFSRSRSHSLSGRVKKAHNEPAPPTAVPKPVYRPVARNASFVPNRTSQFAPGVGVAKAPQYQQDETFNPFNLDTPAKVAKSANDPVGYSAGQNHLAAVNNAVMVNSMGSFAPFVGRNRTRANTGVMAFMANYHNNFTERFERSGVRCLEQAAPRRQGTTASQPMPQNTMGGAWKQHDAFGAHLKQLQPVKVPAHSQTPMGFAQATRINTEPNFQATQGPVHTHLCPKQPTESVYFGQTPPRPTVRLVKSQSVINVLNRLSQMNSTR